jgi:hypothetical protein
MKYALLLLAAMVGAVSGHEVGVKVKGNTPFGESCSVADHEVLYEKCVVDVAVALGFEGRRLELRGSRELQTTGSTCTTCCDNVPEGHPCLDNGCPSCYPYGHWCYTYCDARRLTVADDTERFLYTKGQMLKAANECYDDSISQYPCLGNKKDITVQLYISE